MSGRLLLGVALVAHVVAVVICAAATTCPPNEQLTECIQVICRAQECKAKDWPVACPGIPQDSCIEGCVCQVGYLRDDNGHCIAENECIPNPCKPNEVFSNCTQAICREQNCTDKGMPQACPSVADGDCLGGCVCQEGYLRTEDGYCVPDDQCTAPTCPPNEQFTVCTQTVCRAQKCIEKDWPIACPSVSECIKGCVCQVGYLRDDNGDCIAENKCIPNPCQPNEEYSDCTQAICRAQNCSDKGIAQACPSVADGDCLGGCVCEEGYLRTEEGYCVPEDNCAAVQPVVGR